MTMKKLIYTLVLSIIGLNAFAQFTVTADTILFQGFPKGGSDHKKCYITNTSTTDSLTITWNKTGDYLLSGWSGVSLCDDILCYAFDATAHTFKIGPGKIGFLEVTLATSASAADGCSLTTIRFAQQGGAATTKDVLYKYCAWPTSTKDLEANNIVNIYPNPASDYVNITFNDKKISSVQVVNIIGRKVAKFEVDVNKNNTYRVPLENVSNGIYMLQFADANGKLLGVKRVTKQ